MVTTHVLKISIRELHVTSQKPKMWPALARVPFVYQINRQVPSAIVASRARGVRVQLRPKKPPARRSRGIRCTARLTWLERVRIFVRTMILFFLFGGDKDFLLGKVNLWYWWWFRYWRWVIDIVIWINYVKIFKNSYQYPYQNCRYESAACHGKNMCYCRKRTI